MSRLEPARLLVIDRESGKTVQSLACCGDTDDVFYDAKSKRIFTTGGDGTWIGWLTFVGIDDAVVRKTPRETSQSSLDHLQYWATGLQASYFEGAFARSSP